MKYKLQRMVLYTRYWFLKKQTRLGYWFLDKVHNQRVRVWNYHQNINTQHEIHEDAKQMTKTRQRSYDIHF